MRNIRETRDTRASYVNNARIRSFAIPIFHVLPESVSSGGVSGLRARRVHSLATCLNAIADHAVHRHRSLNNFAIVRTVVDRIKLNGKLRVLENRRLSYGNY